MTTDEQHMARAIQISRFAEGCTMPNPMVGAVIVHDGKIIGEGYHHRAGEPHAEPNAVRNAEENLMKIYDGDNAKVAETLKESTLYVTLEPCSHYGKTPPCAKLLVEKNIRKVVIGTLDCNPLVAGRGVNMLKQAGIEVVTGVMEKECRWVNRRFFTFHEKKRPYIILKWAETADGFIDLKRTVKGDGPLRISNSVTKTLNHQMRCHEGAIMVATNTALLDDPHLTVTKWSGRNPVRVLLDRSLRVPKTARIFDNASKTIVFTEKTIHEGYGGNIEFRTVDFSHDLVTQVFRGLYDSGIQSVIIEGGAQWLNAVIDSGIWDEAHIETSQTIIHQGIAAPHIAKGITETSTVLGNWVKVVYND
ncbi:MAG: bifunctional diaminohydroxyphosphoribosylaminopyrimidine deaminase/5-amino-6-(5-phosphoribosylamino)uracil reductase RibD [Paludibacteraceae bacterium]|nr:bifunctional diaminohydroxyphosphoribosylaminopyrimidine deaminase/5-amino-6-(5-phosphoribosylamino)uracil reductase RibD [Paludibacteraceae bacterium]